MALKGADVHIARLRRMKAIKDPSLRALADAGEVVRADAQQSIRDGAISGKGHVPSQPGKPPNADTHNLDLSIDVVINPSQLSVSVISQAEYSAALEFGTSKIAERPFMRPALIKNRNRVVLGQVQAVHEVVRVYKSQGAFDAARTAYEGSKE